MPRNFFRSGFAALLIAMTAAWIAPAAAQPAPSDTLIRYFPSGPIYEYRWKVLELALNRTRDSEGSFRLQAYAEEITQNRAVQLVQANAIDVVAIGTNAEREQKMLPVRIDILRGLIGYRLLVIRTQEQERIARMDDQTLRKQLIFGLNSQWADLPIMRGNGFSVETSSSYANLFGMLAAGRFDAFPRGLNEAARELEKFKPTFPELTVEQTKALYFPYPIYFWVSQENAALARRIERGLQLALADGSLRKLFETYYATEIASFKATRRQVIYLANPILPSGNAAPDTSWWWHKK